MFWWSRRTVASEIRRLSMRLLRPRAFSIRLIRLENNMALVYSVTAGPVVDHDVVSRNFTVTVDGEEFHKEEFAPATTNFGEISVPQGARVVLTLVDVDDAGNVSDPASLEFTATDTIPPTTPGGFGVTLLRETQD